MIRSSVSRLLICLVFLQAVIPLQLNAASIERPITIGVVVDGPMEGLDQAQAAFLEELKTLTEGEFVIRVPETKQINGEWSTEKIAVGLESIEKDPEVDLVLALGYVTSQLAATRIPLRKPTFAPFIPNASLVGLAPQGGVSGIKNLNYLTSETPFEDELKMFRKAIPFTRLALLIDQNVYQSLRAAAQETIEVARRQGVELSYVTATSVNEDLAAKIPADIQAVMVAPLPRLTKEGRQALIQNLIKRRLPSFSLLGPDDVEQGMLMSTRSSTDLQRLARRTALNMQAVMRGEPAGAQSITFEKKRQLTFNMATARAIGASPRFEVLREAVLLNEIPKTSGPPLSLSEVAREAVKANLGVIAGQLGVKASAENVIQIRSTLFPQLEGDLDYLQRSNDTPLVTTGSAPEKSTEASLTLRQILFSERTLANLSIQKKLQIALEAQQRGLELDVVQQATAAFLNVLIDQTQWRIQQDNVSLAQTNLRLAKDRLQVGRTDASDVYRWESEIATARQRLLSARARLEQAQDRLSRILHRPIAQRSPLEPASMSDPALLVSHQDLLKSVDNEHAFERASEFFIAEGIQQSPEILGLDSRIAAQSRQLRSDQFSYWSPEASLLGKGSRVLDESRISGAPVYLNNQNDWQVGLNLSLPLFAGGSRLSRTEQSKLTLSQLRTQRDDAKDAVEQNVRANLQALSASYPAIELSAQAAEAASKSFKLVRANYVRGTRSVVELLDAQNASLAADQAAANAVYTTLIDLMALQRSMGEFDFLMDAKRRDDLLKRLKAHIAEERS